MSGRRTPTPWLGLFVSAMFSASAHAAEGPPLRTYTYKTVDDLPLQADVYRPDGRGGRPIVLWIHGGGLVEGSRRGLLADQCRLYLQAGFVVVSIDYRLAPETKLPGILEDVADAWAWVRAHASEIGGDPARVALVGHSAGAYLALAGGQRLQPAPRAVVPFYGYGDFFAPERHVGPLYPPTLLLHGDADTAAPAAQSQSMAVALANARIPHRLRMLPGREHTFDRAEGALGQRDVAEAFGDVLVFLSQRLGAAPGVETAVEASSPRRARLQSLVDANVTAVHAFQVLLARKSGKADPACYAARGFTALQLEALHAHQTTLLREDPAAVRAWVEGLPSSFEPARDVEPLRAARLVLAPTLPVNVATIDLSARARGADPLGIRALANLYQTNLEVERDGDRLQELFAFYIALGLPVSVEQIGLPGSDADFLAWGKALAPRTCASPFGTTAAEWQIAGRKIWNWGEKNLHTRDDRVVAGELLAEPDVAALVPRIHALGNRRVAVIGHSFTMGLHWSSPSAFVPFVTEIFRRENPKVEFRQFERGGLTSTRAEQMFLEDALAWKPDTVLLVVANRTNDDLAAFGRIGRAFRDDGAQVFWFDDLGDSQTRGAGVVERNAAAAREAGMRVVEVGARLAAAPGHERFPCLDGIHMTEPWHRFMAREWLALLIDQSVPSVAR